MKNTFMKFCITYNIISKLTAHKLQIGGPKELFSASPHPRSRLIPSASGTYMGAGGSGGASMAGQRESRQVEWDLSHMSTHLN
jgi:hypothetical protein